MCLLSLEIMCCAKGQFPPVELCNVSSVTQSDCYILQTVFRVAALVPSVLKPPVRTLTYCSKRKGKRKTVKSVVHRFLRLHSGLWLRRKVSLYCYLAERQEVKMQLNLVVCSLIFPVAPWCCPRGQLCRHPCPFLCRERHARVNKVEHYSE